MTRDREDHKQGNGSRRPSQIRAEIVRTRNEMDQTLGAIEQRLTPGQLVDQGIDYLKHSGARDYAANLAASVKTHPLPATLTGIGLAWLMAVGSKQAQPGASTGAGAGARMYEAKDRLNETKDRLTGRMQDAKASVGDTLQSARERAAQLGQSARGQMDRARGGWDTMMREHPLALGAVGLALGAVVAAMAPRTEKENQLMGDTRDRLLDDAKETAREKAEQVAQTVMPKKEETKAKPEDSKELKPTVTARVPPTADREPTPVPGPVSGPPKR